MAESDKSIREKMAEGWSGVYEILMVLNGQVAVLTREYENLHGDVKRILEIVQEGTNKEVSLIRRADAHDNDIKNLWVAVSSLREEEGKCKEDRASLQKARARGWWHLLGLVVAGVFSLISLAVSLWLKR